MSFMHTLVQVSTSRPSLVSASAELKPPCSALKSKNAAGFLRRAAKSCRRRRRPTRADTQPKDLVRSHDPSAPTVNTPRAFSSIARSLASKAPLVPEPLPLLLMLFEEPSITARRIVGAAALDNELTRSATAPTPIRPASSRKIGSK